MSLSPSAKKIQEILNNHGSTFEVIELNESARTADQAAQALGCHVSQIVKSLVFVAKGSGEPILVLASGSNRVNEKTIEKLRGQKIAKGDAAFVREVTGFAIGGIPPLGHKQKIETYIDEDLLKFDELWAAAGTPHAVFKLKSDDLKTLTSGHIVPIK
jgi:Cys-tRNA(Pro) deacylase